MIIYIIWGNAQCNRARLYTQMGAGTLERIFELKSKQFKKSSATYGPHFYANVMGVRPAFQVERELRKIYGNKLKQVIEL